MDAIIKIVDSLNLIEELYREQLNLTRENVYCLKGFLFATNIPLFDSEIFEVEVSRLRLDSRNPDELTKILRPISMSALRMLEIYNFGISKLQYSKNHMYRGKEVKIVANDYIVINENKTRTKLTYEQWENSIDEIQKEYKYVSYYDNMWFAQFALRIYSYFNETMDFGILTVARNNREYVDIEIVDYDFITSKLAEKNFLKYYTAKQLWRKIKPFLKWNLETFSNKINDYSDRRFIDRREKNGTYVYKLYNYVSLTHHVPENEAKESLEYKLLKNNLALAKQNRIIIIVTSCLTLLSIILGYFSFIKNVKDSDIKPQLDRIERGVMKYR